MLKEKSARQTDMEVENKNRDNWSKGSDMCELRDEIVVVELPERKAAGTEEACVLLAFKETGKEVRVCL